MFKGLGIFSLDLLRSVGRKIKSVFSFKYLVGFVPPRNMVFYVWEVACVEDLTLDNVEKEVSLSISSCIL